MCSCIKQVAKDNFTSVYVFTVSHYVYLYAFDQIGN
jgi:hypothetical protein